MEIAEGRNGKNRRLEGKGRVQIMGVLSSLYRQWFHLFHFRILGKWAGPAADAVFWVSIITGSKYGGFSV